MKFSVKTLKGELFQVEADPSEKVGDVKVKIQEARSDLAADRQKLIHAGKVLKDEQTISELGISESDFIVCMITKPVPVPAVTTPVAAPTPVVPPAVVPAPAPTPVVDQFQTTEGVQALVSMGFPESECRAALTAAMGNPDLAYEFLLTGIPDSVRQLNPTTSIPSAGTSTSSGGIQVLRQHPQFNMLKQLVQTNPDSLAQVLDLIGQQSPQLLADIHANNEAFIAMMNEPIEERPVTAAAPVSAPAPSAFPNPPSSGANDAANMIRMMSSLPPAQRAQFAQSLGMSPEQLEGFVSMMSSMPPEELQNMLSGAGLGGNPPPNQPGVIRLTHDEMEAVNRLVALGFSQQQAAQAYLACDKNETLAANLLFEGGWGDEDFGGGGGGGHDDEDDMYN